MQVHCESDLFRIKLVLQITRISDPMQLSPELTYHCERVKLFVSLLGGAANAAFSRDFRNVLHLRFYQRVYGCC